MSKVPFGQIFRCINDDPDIPLQAYEDSDQIFSSIFTIELDDVLIYLGSGNKLDVTFMSKHGIVGWNVFNGCDEYLKYEDMESYYVLV